MALVTTCPHCATSFRVVADQLKLRRGLVRCGSCMTVFSGLDQLRRLGDDELADSPVGHANPETQRAGKPDEELDSGAEDYAPLRAPLDSDRPGSGPWEALADLPTMDALEVDRGDEAAFDTGAELEAGLEAQHRREREAGFAARLDSTVLDDERARRGDPHAGPGLGDALARFGPARDGEGEGEGEGDHGGEYDGDRNGEDDPVHGDRAPSGERSETNAGRNASPTGVFRTPRAPAGTPPRARLRDAHDAHHAHDPHGEYDEHDENEHKDEGEHGHTPGRNGDDAGARLGTPRYWREPPHPRTGRDASPDAVSDDVSDQGADAPFSTASGARPAASADGPADEEAAIDYFSAEQRRRGFVGRHGGLKLLLAALLVAALALQAIIFQRDWLAARFPALEPIVAALTEPLGLSIRLPKSLESLSIESFELQASGRSGLFSASAIVRNDARHAVRWPSMLLTLTDSGNRVLVRRIIDPRDYLGNAADQPLRPHSERPIRLALEAEQVDPAGYSVVLFYR